MMRMVRMMMVRVMVMVVMMLLSIMLVMIMVVIMIQLSPFGTSACYRDAGCPRLQPTVHSVALRSPTKTCTSYHPAHNAPRRASAYFRA